MKVIYEKAAAWVRFYGEKINVSPRKWQWCLIMLLLYHLIVIILSGSNTSIEVITYLLTNTKHVCWCHPCSVHPCIGSHTDETTWVELLTWKGGISETKFLRWLRNAASSRNSVPQERAPQLFIQYQAISPEILYIPETLYRLNIFYLCI